MPPYRANLGGAFGSGLQQRPIGGIDVSSAVNAIGNQASSLLQGAYLRKIADQERKAREQQMAAAEEERRIARAEKMEADRIARFTAQLQQEKLLSEMGYVPEGGTQSMAGMQAQGPTGLPIPTGAIVDATRYGDERLTPDGRRFRLDRLNTPEARRIRETQERERIRAEARGQRIADREDEQAFRAGQTELTREAQANRGPSFAQTATAVNLLASRYDADPIVKNAKDVAQSLQRVFATEDSAAGDLSLIFAYMKMLDPGSVVREGEFANAQNAAGVPDQIRNLYNRAMSGERLNPRQRQDFRNQAVGIARGQRELLRRTRERYTRRAEGYDVDPAILFDDPFDLFEELGGTPGTRGVTRPPFDPNDPDD